MKSKLMAVSIVMMASVALLFAGIVAEDMLYKGKVDFDNGSKVDFKGTVKIDGTELTATADQLNASAGGTTAALTPTSVTASGKISSYGYPAVVGHTNGSAQVWLTQSGSVVGDGSTTRTQSFAVVYIATPNVVISSSSAASVTNAPVLSTISSNQFLVITDTVATNFQYIAHGRIK